MEDNKIQESFKTVKNYILLDENYTYKEHLKLIEEAINDLKYYRQIAYKLCAEEARRIVDNEYYGRYVTKEKFENLVESKAQEILDNKLTVLKNKKE